METLWESSTATTHMVTLAESNTMPNYLKVPNQESALSTSATFYLWISNTWDRLWRYASPSVRKKLCVPLKICSCTTKRQESIFATMGLIWKKPTRTTRASAVWRAPVPTCPSTKAFRYFTDASPNQARRWCSRCSLNSITFWTVGRPSSIRSPIYTRLGKSCSYFYL